MDIMYVIYYVILLILIFLLAVMVYYFTLLRRKDKLFKRFSNYIVHSNKEPIKFFDSFFDFFDKIIKYVSKLLKKSKVLIKYSNRYLKYINKDNQDYLDKMDFVSRKLLIGLVFVILLIVINVLKFNNITFLNILISFFVGFYLLDLLLISKKKVIKSEQENDLLKAITIMNNSFKSGKSIMQSIKLVSQELDSKLGLEFQKMYLDLNYGLSIEVVFKRFQERVNIDDLKYITSSLTILSNTGGDIVKVFESVEKTFFNNKKLKDELKNLTAASKFLYYILLFIPIVFVLLIYILDSTYFNILFNSIFGYLIVIICVILYISYIFVIKKLMKGCSING